RNVVTVDRGRELERQRHRAGDGRLEAHAVASCPAVEDVGGVALLRGDLARERAADALQRKGGLALADRRLHPELPGAVRGHLPSPPSQSSTRTPIPV